MFQFHTFLPLPEQDLYSVGSQNQKLPRHRTCIYNSEKGHGFVKSYSFSPYQKPDVSGILQHGLKYVRYTFDFAVGIKRGRSLKYITKSFFLITEFKERTAFFFFSDSQTYYSLNVTGT